MLAIDAEENSNQISQQKLKIELNTKETASEKFPTTGGQPLHLEPVKRNKTATTNELSSYSRLYQDLKAAPIALTKKDGPPSRPPKEGRNALCSCGSGKKYKKCHGRSV